MRYCRYILAVILAIMVFSIFTQPAAAAEPTETAASDAKPAADAEEEKTEEEKKKEAYEKELQAVYQLPVQSNELEDWAQGPGTYGDAAIVMEAGSGAILYAKNIDAREYPASITKVLTALLAYEYGDMNSNVDDYEGGIVLSWFRLCVNWYEGGQLDLYASGYARDAARFLE